MYQGLDISSLKEGQELRLLFAYGRIYRPFETVQVARGIDVVKKCVSIYGDGKEPNCIGKCGSDGYAIRLLLAEGEGYACSVIISGITTRSCVKNLLETNYPNLKDMVNVDSFMYDSLGRVIKYK